MSGASIGIIVPCVQAWTQTLGDKIRRIDEAARVQTLQPPLTDSYKMSC